MRSRMSPLTVLLLLASLLIHLNDRVAVDAQRSVRRSRGTTPYEIDATSSTSPPSIPLKKNEFRPLVALGIDNEAGVLVSDRVVITGEWLVFPGTKVLVGSNDITEANEYVVVESFDIPGESFINDFYAHVLNEPVKWNENVPFAKLSTVWSKAPVDVLS